MRSVRFPLFHSDARPFAVVSLESVGDVRLRVPIEGVRRVVHPST